MEPTKENYLPVFLKLLPRGAAIARTLDSWVSKLLRGLLGVFVSVHLRTLALLREMDPRSTLEFLSVWEKFAGLPDECSLVQGTTSERRQAVVSKLTAVGHASIQYYLDLAAALGYSDATITEFSAARFRRRRFGQRYGKKEWEFTWQLNIPSVRITKARFGDRFGTRFKQGGNTILECRILKLKAAHKKVIFNYGA
jgi:uncharacterized protein YmfQ (DUF2313 family)